MIRFFSLKLNNTIIILVFLLFIKGISHSQVIDENTSVKQENPLNNLSFKERLYVGGNVSFNIYSGWILLDASPFLGYKVTEKYSAGFGIKYIYRGFPEQNINQSYYGGNIFSRYQFTKNFIAHSEYELLRVYDIKPISSTFGERTLASMFYIGGAYSTSIGGTATVQIMMLYDLINDYNSPYRSYYIFGASGPPILYRVGFSVGF